MTVPMIFDLCRKRKWAVEFTSNGPITGVKIKNSRGATIGQANSVHATEETFAMALLEASRKPTEEED